MSRMQEIMEELYGTAPELGGGEPAAGPENGGYRVERAAAAETALPAEPAPRRDVEWDRPKFYDRLVERGWLSEEGAEQGAHRLRSLEGIPARVGLRRTAGESGLETFNRWNKALNPFGPQGLAQATFARAQDMTVENIPRVGQMSKEEVEDGLTRMSDVHPDPGWERELVGRLPNDWDSERKHLFAQGNWMVKTAREHEEWAAGASGEGYGEKVTTGLVENVPYMLPFGLGSKMAQGASRPITRWGLRLGVPAALEAPKRYAELRSAGAGALDEGGMPVRTRMPAGRGEAVTKAAVYGAVDPFIEIAGGELVGRAGGRALNWMTGGRTGRALGALGELGYRVTGKVPVVTQGGRRAAEMFGWQGMSPAGFGVEVLEEALQKGLDAVGNLSNAYDEAGIQNLPPAAKEFWDELPEIAGVLGAMTVGGVGLAAPGARRQARTVKEELRARGIAEEEIKGRDQTARIQLLNEMRDQEVLQAFGPEGMGQHEMTGEDIAGLDPVARRDFAEELKANWYVSRGIGLGMTAEEAAGLLDKPEVERQRVLAERGLDALLDKHGVDHEKMTVRQKQSALREVVEDRVAEVAGESLPGGTVEDQLNFLAGTIRGDVEGRPWERGYGETAPEGVLARRGARLRRATLEDVGQERRVRREPWGYVEQVFTESPRTSITTALRGAGLDENRLANRSRAGELRGKAKSRSQESEVRSQKKGKQQEQPQVPAAAQVVPGQVVPGQAVPAEGELSEGARGILWSLQSLPAGQTLFDRELGKPADVKGPLAELEGLGLVERQVTGKGSAVVVLTEMGKARRAQKSEVRSQESGVRSQKRGRWLRERLRCPRRRRRLRRGKPRPARRLCSPRQRRRRRVSRRGR